MVFVRVYVGNGVACDLLASSQRPGPYLCAMTVSMFARVFAEHFYSICAREIYVLRQTAASVVMGKYFDLNCSALCTEQVLTAGLG